VAHAQGGGRRFACAGEGGGGSRSQGWAEVRGGLAAERRCGHRPSVAVRDLYQGRRRSVRNLPCIYLKGSRTCKFHQSLPGELASYIALRSEDRRFDS
jgi:hypothetical protein